MRQLFIALFVSFAINTFGQQVADTAYHPVLSHPAYALKQGPVVFIDEGHHNFHTRDGRYAPFAKLLESDGYKVKSYRGIFTEKDLSVGKILVISNALNQRNVDDWTLPTPSAFSHEEIEIVKDWVATGGSLFLIADHMPMAGAASELAATFGFEISNGFVFHDETEGSATFQTINGGLSNHAIIRGRDSTEHVSSVTSFTGQGFRAPADALSILVFDEKYTSYTPDTAWVFNEQTPQVNMKGWSQGASKTFGKGRIIIWGEAAMFTAQLAGLSQEKVGMNNYEARQNYQLLLNIIHWLDGLY